MYQRGPRLPRLTKTWPLTSRACCCIWALTYKSSEGSISPAILRLPWDKIWDKVRGTPNIQTYENPAFAGLF